MVGYSAIPLKLTTCALILQLLLVFDHLARSHRSGQARVPSKISLLEIQLLISSDLPSLGLHSWQMHHAQGYLTEQLCSLLSPV